MSRKPNKQVPMAEGPPDSTVDLPCEDLSELEKAAVLEALVVAWNRLVESQGGPLDLDHAGETEITRALRNKVDDLRIDPSHPVPGFGESTFQHVPESETTPDCTGSLANDHQYEPDLVFRPTHLASRLRTGLSSVAYGLFVECKIIDHTKAHGHHKVKEYCAKGLMRFVNREYAWAMPSAMMVAYVRDGSDVSSSLGPHLAEDPHRRTCNVRRPPMIARRRAVRTTARRISIPPLYVSSHGRPSRAGCTVAATDIEISHLWLQLSVSLDAPAKLGRKSQP